MQQQQPSVQPKVQSEVQQQQTGGITKGATTTTKCTTKGATLVAITTNRGGQPRVQLRGKQRYNQRCSQECTTATAAIEISWIILLQCEFVYIDQYIKGRAGRCPSTQSKPKPEPTGGDVPDGYRFVDDDGQSEMISSDPGVFITNIRDPTRRGIIDNIKDIGKPKKKERDGRRIRKMTLTMTICQMVRVSLMVVSHVTGVEVQHQVVVGLELWWSLGNYLVEQQG